MKRFCMVSWEAWTGGTPYAGLLRDSGGNLYGATQVGGGGDCPYGCGVVFKLDPAGHETVLHTFPGATSRDGAFPREVLIRDSKANLYVATQYGGAFDSGAVFKLDTAGKERCSASGETRKSSSISGNNRMLA